MTPTELLERKDEENIIVRNISNSLALWSESSLLCVYELISGYVVNNTTVYV